MISKKVKEAKRYGGGPAYEHGRAGGTDYLRDSEGVWRFADSHLPVPGARDLTLTERFEPKRVVAADGKIERIVVSGQSILDAPDLLGWCLEQGTKVEDQAGDVSEVLVPYELWQERDRIPNALVAPEHSEDEAEREVALAERGFREAEKALEEAADKRANMLRRYAGQMTRQEARAITGLSVGRIQQLIKDEKLDQVEVVLLRALEGGPVSGLETVTERGAALGLVNDANFVRRELRELQMRGLVIRRGASFTLTDAGQIALLSAAEATGEDASE